MKGEILLDYNIADAMQYKLNEAKFFYEHMEKLALSDNTSQLGYYLSAFSSALRSVLQYANEHDKKKYQKHISKVKSKDFFKELRDTNIHREPVIVSKLQKLEIPINIQITIKSTVTRERLDEMLRTIPVEKLIEQGVIEMRMEDSTERVLSEYCIVKNQVEHFIDHSLIDKCKVYVKEVKQFTEVFLANE